MGRRDITTVGYGDRYPVTAGGRTAVFVMVMGLGIIGALASLLSSLLVAPPSTPEPEKATGTAAESAIAPAPSMAAAASAASMPTDAIAQELAGLRAEIAALRASLGSTG